MKKRQNLDEEETKKFNGSCSSIKQLFRTPLEDSGQFSICFTVLGLSNSGNISYPSVGEGLGMKLGNK